MKLDARDIAYYKKHLEEAKKFKADEFDGKIDLKMYKAYYSAEDSDEDQLAQDMTAEGTVWISNNKLFPATNRVAPTFYWQNPRIVCKARKGGSDFAAELATAKLNYEYKERGLKKLNQAVILDAWYSGFGACKIGYTTVFNELKPKKQGLIDKLKDKVTGKEPDTSLDEKEYIEYEGIWIKRLDPKDVFFDPRTPVNEDKIIWLHYPRTLQEVIESPMYPKLDKKFIDHFKGGRDEREVDIDLYEGWVRLKDGLYICVYAEGWNDPIRWEKSSWLGDGFPMSFLSFAEVPDTKYPPSFMKVALKPQQQISYLSTLQGRVVDKFRLQTGVNEQAVTAEGKSTLESNEVGGVVLFKGPVMGNIGEIASSRVPADLYQLIADQQANLQEILNASGLQLGSAEQQKTLGQEQIVQAGNTQGLTGIQDKVREFIIDQAGKMLQFIKQYATAEEFIPLAGEKIMNPNTGKPITEEWLEFGTQNNPMTLKEAIEGNYDIEVDIKGAQQQNDMMKMQAAMTILPQLKAMEPDLAMEGEKVNMGKAARMLLGIWKEVVPEIEHVVERMTPEERQALQQKMAEAEQQQRQMMEQQQTSQSLENLSKSQDIAQKATAPTEEERMALEAQYAGAGKTGSET